MAYLGTQPNDVKKNTGLYTPSEILQLTKDGSWGGSLELIEEQTVSGVSFIDFTSIQENKYDVHYMTVNAYTGSNINIRLRFYESGVLETANVYQQAHQWGANNGTFLEIKDTGDGEIEVANTTSDPSSAYVYLYNLGDSTKYSMTTHQSSFFQSAGDYNMTFGSAVYPTAETINAIRLTTSSGNLNATATLYGIKEYS